jgi:hypothetical protein
MEVEMRHHLFSAHAMRERVLYALALTSAVALTGCVAYPAGPAPVLSRLPATSPSAAPTQAHPLTQAEKQRYDRIDKQVLSDQKHAMEAQAAQAWAGYYPVAPAVTVYGGYPYGGYPYGGYPYGGYPYYGGYPGYYGGYYGPGW